MMLTFTSATDSIPVSVPIREDSIVEGTEQFSANLEVDNAVFPNVIVDPDNHDVIILDDDGTQHAYVVHNNLIIRTMHLEQCIFIYVFQFL